MEFATLTLDANKKPKAKIYKPAEIDALLQKHGLGKKDEDAEMAGSDEAGTVKRGKALDGASARRGPRTGRDHDGKVSAAEDLQRVRRYKW